MRFPRIAALGTVVALTALAATTAGASAVGPAATGPAARSAVARTTARSAMAGTTAHAAVAGTAARSAVAGLGAIPVPGALDRGAVLGSAAVTVVLQPRDRAGLAAFLRRQQVAAAAHRPPPLLSAQEYGRRFAPAPNTIAAVRAWAHAAGLSVVSVSANGTLVRISAPASRLAAAFGTTLHQFQAPGVGSFVASTVAGRLPAALAGEVSAVVGLSDIGRLRTASHRASTTSVDYFRSYGPADVDALYDAPPTEVGVAESVAVLASGDMAPVLSDLRAFEQAFNLPAARVALRFVDGGSPDRANTDEWDLDTQYSTGLAPGAGLILYTGRSLNDADVLDEINAFVSEDAARTGSASLGECEAIAALSGFETAVDQVLAQGAAQGQTLFASTGDNGSFCPAGPAGVNGVPVGLTNVEYPAASRFAVGVGGTTVLAPGRHPNEIAWYGSGGGLSAFEPLPSWQAGVGGSSLRLSRGVPDVALDADPNSGFAVVVNGKMLAIGGTSASTPAWAAFWARAEGAHRGRLGYANPVLYRLPASTFRDITTGGNGTFAATSGYDYVTGRGAPDVTALVARA